LFSLQASTAQTYYVDCAAGSDSSTGISESAPWRSLAKLSQTTFSPGDRILLKRGSRCSGMLAPRGSGQPGNPIRVGAYGAGALPVIEAGKSEAAVKLFDQQYWEVENLETTGGDPYGVFVSGTKGVLKHFVLRNLLVRDVTGTPKTKNSGLVVVRGTPELVLEDVTIDGVTARSTTQWSGIVVSGGSRESRVKNVVVRNSVAHHIWGDGIVLWSVDQGLVEKSATWATGLQPTQTIGTPNGIWTWTCRDCVVQWTEGFFVDSPGVDGGVYDIDWGNDNNIIQYNYGHDAMGYCLSVFGAGNQVTTNSIVRYNVCVNNGRSPKLARRQGDMYISTWEGGKIDGLLIHNNTFYWNPPIDVPVVQIDQADFTGSMPNVFRDNLIYSHVPSMVHANKSLQFENNVYWTTGKSPLQWTWGGRTYTGIDGWRAATGSAANEQAVYPAVDALLRPRTNSPLLDTARDIAERGAVDAFGTRLPQGGRADIGAIESRAGQKVPVLDANRKGKWTLTVMAHAGSLAEARSNLVFVQAALAQYGERLLEANLAVDLPSAEFANLAHDWHLGDVKLTKAVRSPGMAASGLPLMTLTSPKGEVAAQWQGFVAPAELGLTIRHHLGAPIGSPEIELVPVSPSLRNTSRKGDRSAMQSGAQN
jgi:hypothetical protein